MTTDNPLARTHELLWNGLPEPKKGPRPTLTLDVIVEAAVELADADGIDALSMRRLARELDVGTMSLYRYIPGKFELINLMLDCVLGSTGHRFDDLGTDWRAVLERAAREGRQTYLRHPWLLQVNNSRPVLGPNSLADLDATLAGLRELPMSDREKIAMVTAIDGFVIGTVREELLYEKAAEETGLSEDEFWELQLPYLEAAMESDGFPTLQKLAEDSFGGNWEESFELGLESMLDGLELRVRARLSPSP